jgi:hypothetical protein
MVLVLIKQNNTTLLSVFFTVLIVLTALTNHTMPGTDAFQPAVSKRVKHPLTYCEAGRVSGKLNEEICVSVFVWMDRIATHTN